MAGNTHFEVHKGTDEKFYWRLRDRNGEIVSDGAQGYQTQADCADGLRNVAYELAAMVQDSNDLRIEYSGEGT